jgi:chromosome segregation and condensation protein ScpB
MEGDKAGTRFCGRGGPSLGSTGMRRQWYPAVTLGLAIPVAQALLRRQTPGTHTERQLITLAACLFAGRGGTLAALADATGVSAAAVREQLSELGDRMAAVGLAIVQDGHGVRLLPFPWLADTVSRVATVEVQQALTKEAIEVLVVIGVLGVPTRRQIEARCGGGDCASLLDRLCRRGVLNKVRDDSLPGDPNTYGLTALALGLLGHSSLESFQARCHEAGL